MITRWWLLKESSQLSLIGMSLIRALGLVFDPPDFATPLYLGPGIVVGAGVAHLYNAFLLRRKAGNLEALETLQACQGFYRVIRHPMYFCQGIMMGGFVLFAGGYICIVIHAVGLYGLFKLARWEDEEMAKRFGEEHAAWKTKTKLIIPGVY